MDSLRNINKYLDADFERRFELNEFIQDTKEETIEEFDIYFEDMYNGEFDYVDLEEIKQLCDFNKVMSICAYVAERYDDYDMTIETSHFEDKDKILKAYIYFYYCDKNKPNFIQQIEAFDFEAGDDEETEELPPANMATKTPKCANDWCSCSAAKNEYYPNSEGGEYWTLCEECYIKDQEE